MKKLIIVLTTAMLLTTLSAPAQNPEGPGMILKENWAIKSSAEVKAGGREISTAGFSTQGWYRTTMPSTILAALVANNVFPDPYYGTNINKLPGQITNRNRGIPPDSPFSVAWWYRTEFQLPASYKGKHIWINFHSINYKANIWLTGNL